MAGKNEIDFDFEALEAELYSGLAKAFTSLQLDFPDERFYNFTLYLTAGMESVGIAATTEDGLDATALRYRDKYPKYASVGINDTKAYFRHEFGDFVFFAHGHDMRPYNAFLEKADKLLSKCASQSQELLEYWLDRLNDDFDEAFEYVWLIHERILDMCQSVMKRLDKDKVFELNSQRDNVTLLMRHGDSEADPEIARQLNPNSVYLRFLRENEHAEKARKLIHGS